MKIDEVFEGFDEATSGDTTIASAWAFFSKNALPEGCADMQRHDMHYAFWAGCATVFAKIADIMSGDDPERRELGLHAVADEIAAMSDAVTDKQLALHRAQPGEPVVTGRIVKVDADTGEEVYASPEENRKVLEMMRQALDRVEGGIVFSEEATAKLRERGVSEDEIKSMLAATINHKQ